MYSSDDHSPQVGTVFEAIFMPKRMIVSSFNSIGGFVSSLIPECRNFENFQKNDTHFMPSTRLLQVIQEALRISSLVAYVPRIPLDDMTYKGTYLMINCLRVSSGEI